MLILDSIRMMDSIWKNANLDLRMTSYNCIATGINHGKIILFYFKQIYIKKKQQKGMIEAVVPTMTTAKIVAEHYGMLSAMTTSPLLSWLIDRARVSAMVLI